MLSCQDMSNLLFFTTRDILEANSRAELLKKQGYETEIKHAKLRQMRWYEVWGKLKTVDIEMKNFVKSVRKPRSATSVKWAS